MFASIRQSIFVDFCFTLIFTAVYSLSWFYDFLFSSFVSIASRIVISGIPLHARFEDIEPLLKTYGKVEQCDAVSNKDPNTQAVHITYETVEQAQRYFLILRIRIPTQQQHQPQQKKTHTFVPISIFIGQATYFAHDRNALLLHTFFSAFFLIG